MQGSDVADNPFSSAIWLQHLSVQRRCTMDGGESPFASGATPVPQGVVMEPCWTSRESRIGDPYDRKAFRVVFPDLRPTAPYLPSLGVGAGQLVKPVRASTGRVQRMSGMEWKLQCPRLWESGTPPPANWLELSVGNRLIRQPGPGQARSLRPGCPPPLLAPARRPA